MLRLIDQGLPDPPFWVPGRGERAAREPAIRRELKRQAGTTDVSRVRVP